MIYYSRTRFIVNLLPLIQQASSLRRVVTVLAGGKEGPVDTSDIDARKVPLLSARGHAASLITFSLEALAKQAPNVSFVHDFPGFVKTDIASKSSGVAMSVLSVVSAALAPFFSISAEECGERHLFLSTSAKYPPGSTSEGAEEAASGVPLADQIEVARGTDGKVGSGVYSIGSDVESVGPDVEALLAKLRNEGIADKIWEHTEGEFKRITGAVAA